MLKERIKKVFILIFIVVIISGISIWVSSNHLAVAEYTVTGDVDEVIRIVHLSDLHNKEFGEANVKLVEKVKNQNPDLIFMTGDILNKDEEADIVCRLIQKLTEIAPVYWSHGNDEIDWEKGTCEELEQKLEGAGARVLNCEYVDVEVKEEELRIGGYYGYYRTPHMQTRDEEAQKAEIAFADEFERTDRMKVLLAHIPTTWLDWKYRDEFPVDLIFCGHYHGGQIRIPFAGGLFAPYVGWFPEYTKGMFEGEQGTCILSAGLGSEHLIPRFNNPPEIVVIDLIPKS